MKFDKGVVGVVIVVIALFGTIFTGYFMNVDQETVTVNDYDRVTDVSSLFNYTQQPDYIEYNPAKNYTGYMLSDGSSNGVSYTHASGVNQYPMSTVSSTTITVDLSILNGTTQFKPSSSNATVDGYETNAFQPYLPNLGGTKSKAWFEPYTINAQNLLDYLETNNLIPSNTVTMTIHPKNAETMVGLSLNPDLNVSSPRSYATISQATPTTYPSAYGETINYYRNVNVNVSSEETQSTMPIQNFATPQQCYMSYDFDSELWTLDANGDSMTMPYGVLSWPSSNRGVLTWVTIGTYPSVSTNYHAEEYTLQPYDTYVDIIFSHSPVYNYLKPSDGVAINHNTLLSTNWSNGKNIGDLGIAFKKNGANNWCGFDTNTGLYVGILWNGSNDYIRVEYNGDLLNDIPIGMWDSFELHISPYTQSIYVVPIMTFNSFTDYTTANYKIDITTIPNTPITMLKWYGTPYSFNFSVSSTLVQMSTKLLMINPALNITDYFTFNEGYRLDINSFAKYGTSMTVNGVTLYGDENNNPISDKNTVYYDGKTYKLTNIQIEKNALDGHTYINFVNDKKSIDLGASTSDVVSMAGLWYFNTQLDEGKVVESSTYTWDWANALTSTQSIVVFMGFIVVASLIARRFWTLKILDLAVIVSSIVLLWTVTGLI